MRIDGKEIANKILNELEKRVQKLKEKGIVPTLAIILVGDNPASVSYVKQKELKASQIGIRAIVKNFPSGTSEANLLKTIEQLNNDRSVHGIIVQRPVKGADSKKLDETVVPEKDVDGFNPQTNFDYPIAKAVFTILEQIYTSNKKNDQFVDFLRRSQIVLIGKGKTGGFPIIQSFKKLNISLKVVGSSTQNSSSIIHNSDIVISAVGKQNVVKPESLKRGVILVGVGLSKGNDGKLYGDYNEEKIREIASFYTPTPGGVGPVNVACLLKNLVIAAERSK